MKDEYNVKTLIHTSISRSPLVSKYIFRSESWIIYKAVLRELVQLIMYILELEQNSKRVSK